MFGKRVQSNAVQYARVANKRYCMKISLQDPNKNPKKTIKLARELSDLVTYCKSVAFQDFQYSSENRKYIDCALLQRKAAVFIKRSLACYDSVTSDSDLCN